MNRENGDLTVGEFLRTIRLQKRFTQCAIADRSGFKPSYICKLEKGTPIPYGSREKIAEAYAMTESERADFTRLADCQPQNLPKNITPLHMPNAVAVLSALTALPPDEYLWVVNSATTYREMLGKKN